MTYPPQQPYGQQPPPQGGGGWQPPQQPGQQPPQGYQPTQQYGMPPGFGYPEEEPPKKRTPLIVGIVVVVLLLAAVGVTGFWQPGFFLAADDEDPNGGGGTSPSSSQAAPPTGTNPSGDPQPPKPTLQTPGSQPAPGPDPAPTGAPTPTGGGGTNTGEEGAVTAKANQFVSAFNARNVDGVRSAACNPEKADEMNSMPEDARMALDGEPKVTGSSAKVPVKITAGGDSQTTEMPLNKDGGSWCVEL